MKNKLVLAVAAALLTTACTTHLVAQPDGSGRYATLADNTYARAGAVYAVPMLQFKLNVTRTLTQCVNDEKKSDIQFGFKVTAEQHYVAGERFVLDYEALSGWSKTGKVDLVTFDNGVLKSLNGSAEDHTAAIVSDVVASGASIARLVMGVPKLPTENSNTPDGGPRIPTPTLVCSTEALGLLKAQKESGAVIKAESKKLQAYADEIDHLTRLLALEIIDQPSKKRLAELLPLHKAAGEAVDEASKAAQAVTARLTARDEAIWPRSPIQFEDPMVPAPVNASKLMALFTPYVAPAAGDSQTVPVGPGNTEDALLQSLNVWVRLQATTFPADDVITKATEAEGVSPAQKAENIAAIKKDKEITDSTGLFYRNAVPARLLMCRDGNVQDCDVASAAGVVVSNGVMAPQLGALRMLPLTNGVFQNNQLNVTFREDGSLATLTYEEKAARGKALSGAVVGALDKAVEFRDQNEAYKDTKRKNADGAAAAKKQTELDELDHSISLLKKQDELNKLQSPDLAAADTAETAQINARIAVLEARKRQIEAEKALADASGGN